jgi:hypothetical protein
MMVSDEPGDRELVLAAARLGWTLAELRGRVRESVSGPPLDRARPKGILPLGQERSQKEQLIEYGNVVSGLAKRLDVDVPAQTLSHAPTDVAGKSASEWLRRSVWAVANPPDPDDTARLKWASRELANVYYAWDAAHSGRVGRAAVNVGCLPARTRSWRNPLEPRSQKGQRRRLSAGRVPARGRAWGANGPTHRQAGRLLRPDHGVRPRNVAPSVADRRSGDRQSPR